MPVIGVTGGVATGKSTFSAALCRHLPSQLFDADQCSRELLAYDPRVREEVRLLFGPQAFNVTGQPDRAWLRKIVFADPIKRRELEAILHPAIRARWTALSADAVRAGRWFCADIPLLFETSAEAHFTAIIVVGCSSATQRARLLQNRHLSENIADQIVAAQLDLTTKIAQADHLIWNEFTASCLDRQARLLAATLRQRHG